jgi:hypothetical protein
MEPPLFKLNERLLGGSPTLVRLRSKDKAVEIRAAPAPEVRCRYWMLHVSWHAATRLIGMGVDAVTGAALDHKRIRSS